MVANTVKTVFGYGVSLLAKHTPLKFSKDNIEGIYNYLPITDGLSTSGQPTEQQFEKIKEAGFKTVINLAPHQAENALANEAEVLRALDLNYIHIPVDFKMPTDADFAAFVSAIQPLLAKKRKVWVHCAANMRVSAFIYRYRCEILGESRGMAEADLHKIWQPVGVWRGFISA